jgi:hypothetical protein
MVKWRLERYKMMRIIYRKAKNSNVDIVPNDELIVRDEDLGIYVDILIKAGMVVDRILNIKEEQTSGK